MSLLTLCYRPPAAALRHARGPASTPRALLHRRPRTAPAQRGHAAHSRRQRARSGLRLRRFGETAAPITATARRRPRAQPSAGVSWAAASAQLRRHGRRRVAGLPACRSGANGARQEPEPWCALRAQQSQEAGGALGAGMRRRDAAGAARPARARPARHGAPAARLAPLPPCPPCRCAPPCTSSSFLSLLGARLKLPAVLAAAGARAGVAGGAAHQRGDGAAARRARPSPPAPPLARLARRGWLVAHARGSHAPPSAMRRCRSARRSARARRRRGERAAPAYARPPPLCCKVGLRAAPPTSPYLCQRAVVSPRLAPSLDLTGAVTLFQALHMCKSDEGVVSIGGAVLDAPKICAAVAACWR